MKKCFYSILATVFIAILCILLLFLPKKETSALKKIRVAEVAHSIFYAPQYVADALGYFEEEGLSIELILASGADKVTSAVLSGDVEIGLCGSEATIYVYNGGEKDYLVNFSALTKRDGSFIVSRKPIKDFTLQDLKGSTIIGGRVAGMPEMTLEWVLKEHGIDPKEDLLIDTSIAFSSMSGAFIGGTGDFVTLFEPQATEIEKNGYGTIVASLGELGGVVPYTAYNAKKSFLEENPEVISSFRNAIQKGLQYVHSHSAEEIAELLTSYFPDTTKEDLVTILNRYIENDTWFSTTEIKEEDFLHIEEIIKSAGELENMVPYEKLVLQ